MRVEAEVKREVRQFYDDVGWKQVGEGLYQNIRYEDLRPVSRDYIRRCRERVSSHIPAGGKYLLDAGSGPIQYPEYVEYSRSFQYRVCLDISVRALREARARIGDHGLFVLGDLTRLPFRTEAFPGAISLHVVYHLPAQEQEKAFREIHRVLSSPGKSVVVYSWGKSALLMRLAEGPVRAAQGLLKLIQRLRRRVRAGGAPAGSVAEAERHTLLTTPGHYSFNYDVRWVRRTLGDLPGLDIRVWRSLSTPFLRALVHGPLGGRFGLALLYRLEEAAPSLF
ncbi:MAG: class I SAM-dependent methyltransferase, partial [Anaerolineales bacterium]